jgi:peptide/nickel transport system substrate-binding protein
MRRSALAITVCLFASAFGAAGCSQNSSSVGGDRFAARYQPGPDARRGGQLRVIGSGDYGSLDPGQVLNQATFMVTFATQRTLFSISADSSSTLVPDLADRMPEVEFDRGVLKVRLRRDVRFSPPLNRRVRSDDVRYAIERALMPGVANGEIETYLDGLIGLDQARMAVRRDPRRAPDISGIACPSPDLIVFRFKGPVPPLVQAALTLPATAPVPREYARMFDRSIPSDYGEHVVSSGPYMVARNASGELTGYKPGTSISLVRNPNWNASGDFRPAYLDEIDLESGYTNPSGASRQILSGASMVNGDFPVPPLVLESAASEHPEQLTLASSSVILYSSLNTRVPPFDNPDVRRAVIAATDRNAMRLAIGGRSAGSLATHFLPPEVDGFEQAGGEAGPGFNFLGAPDGNPALAARYMRRAGYPSGRYDGDARPVMVTDTSSQGRRFAEILRQAVESLGIEVDEVQVSRDTMYSTYCNVPAKRVGICPNVGWLGQFGDGQTVLAPTFNGEAIRPVNNSNWPLLNVRGVNLAINEAKQVTGRQARARSWGAVDRRITALAPAVPVIWLNVSYVSSSNVNLVLERSATTPALPMISLKDD